MRRISLIVTAGGILTCLTGLVGAADKGEPNESTAATSADPVHSTNGDAPRAAGGQRTITGKVQDSAGNPVVADLWLSWLEAKPQYLGKSNSDGVFTATAPLQVSSRGGLLVVRAAGYGMDFQPHGIKFLPQSMTASAEMSFTLPKERAIKGRVIDQQGEPVMGAVVIATKLSAFNSEDAMRGHLKNWATETARMGSAPQGDRSLWYSDERAEELHVGSPLLRSATTDESGEFELSGIGEGQLVHLEVRGPRVATERVVVLNVAGFDANPWNKMARDIELKGFKSPVLYGSTPIVVMELEQLIRGRVTDEMGRPRAGVTVAFTRPDKQNLVFDYAVAVTNHDGQYEIHGARKHTGYMVEIPSDPDAGLLRCQGFAEDTAGYEPITINLQCAKGVVIHGKLTDKVTGEPIAGQVYVVPVMGNTFESRYPPMQYASASIAAENLCAADGSFRIVSIPGPVLLMAGAADNSWAYKPVEADPDYPKLFARSPNDALVYFPPDGAYGYVHGNWCKVLEVSESTEFLQQDVALEPTPKTVVRVVDLDGNPVRDVQLAGESRQQYWVAAGAVTFRKLEPNQQQKWALFQAERRLVGTLTLRWDDENPQAILGPGGSVSGRVLDQAGNPMAEVEVGIEFEQREVNDAFGEFVRSVVVTTNANGEFLIPSLFPNEAFRLTFGRGQEKYGLEGAQSQSHVVARHGDVLMLGDLKVAPLKESPEK